MKLKICIVLISMFTTFQAVQIDTTDTRLIEATNSEKASTLDCADSTNPTFACLAACTADKKGGSDTSEDPGKLPSEAEKVFKSAQRNLAGNIIQKQHKISTFCTRKAQGVKLEIVGNRQVHFSLKRKLTWFGAQKFCRSKGLKLGGVDTKDREKALTAFITRQTGLNKTDFEMWSSGCNLASRDKSFYSVESGLPPPQALKKTDKKPAKSTCQFLQKWNVKSDTVTSSDETCKMEKLFFCEPDDMCYEFALGKMCSNPKCPMIPCTAEKNITMQALAKRVQAKFEVKYIGSKAYFISNIQASYLEATMLCCKLLGFPLVSLKSKGLKYCMSRQMKVGSGTYWSSGIGDSCDSKYAWCGLDEDVGPEFEWTRGALHDSRGNTDNCLAVDVAAEGNYRLVSMACNTKSLFICEGDMPPVKATVTKAVVTTTTKAPAVDTTEEPVDCQLFRMQQYFCIASCISYVRDDTASSLNKYKGACTAPPTLPPPTTTTTEVPSTSSGESESTSSEENSEDAAGDVGEEEEEDTTTKKPEINTKKLTTTVATKTAKTETTTAAEEESGDVAAEDATEE